MVDKPKPPNGYNSWLDVWSGMDEDEFKTAMLSDDLLDISGWHEIEELAREELKILQNKFDSQKAEIAEMQNQLREDESSVVKIIKRMKGKCNPVIIDIEVDPWEQNKRERETK